MTIPLSVKVRPGLLDLSLPKIMGVINVTPDSFFSGSRIKDTDEARRRVEKMIHEGVDIVDIGAVSTRPGSESPSVDEELFRLVPILESLRKEFPHLIISIDTFRHEVLEAAVAIGIDMVNDISAGEMDENLIGAIAKYELPYILMHMRGRPENMQDIPPSNDIMVEMLCFFAYKLKRLRQFGIIDVLIDPGIGFGKTMSDNFMIIRKLETLRIFDCPILIGLSRKSFIYKALGINPSESLNGTTAMHMMSIAHGANILRVHDVLQAKECIRLWQKYRGD